MKQEDDSLGSCFAMLIMLAMIGLGFYVFGRIAIDVVEFFSAPHLLQRIVNLLKTGGMCCGAGLVFFGLWWVWSEIFPPEYSGDDDDSYY